MYLSILAVVLLLAANAFFVAAEFALVKVRAIMRIEAMAAAGSRPARLADRHPQASRGLSRRLPARHHHGVAGPGLGRRAGRGRRARAAVPLAGPRRAAAAHRVVRCGLPALLVAAHRASASRCPRRFAIRQPEPISLWVAAPAAWLLPALLAAELGAQHRVARHPPPARAWPRPATSRSFPGPSCAS